MSSGCRISAQPYNSRSDPPAILVTMQRLNISQPSTPEGEAPVGPWPTHHDRVCTRQLNHLLKRHPNGRHRVMGATGSGKTSVCTGGLLQLLEAYPAAPSLSTSQVTRTCGSGRAWSRALPRSNSQICSLSMEERSSSSTPRDSTTVQGVTRKF